MPGPKRPKCRDYERERRERLNKSFFELSCLLPDHDPTLPLSKLDILTKATSYIKHLQEQNMKLMENSENSDTQEKEIMQLKQRITELLRRTRQLAELLQSANIHIPTDPPADDFDGPMKMPMKWSGRMRQDTPKEVLEDHQKRREEREKRKKEKQLINKAKMKSKSKVFKKMAKCKKISATLSSVVNSCFIKDQNMTAVPQVLNVDLNLSSHLNTSNVSTPLREINNALPPNKVSNCVTTYSKTITLPCTTTVSIVISNSKPDQVVTVAKSNILTAPIMTTGIQPVLQRNPALTNLGPGTLILPDGRIMPVPGPQPQTVLQAPTQYIVNRPVSQPAVIVMQNIGTPLKPSLSQKSQRLLIPKPKRKDSTKTTFVNKLPIPAIKTQQPTSVSVDNNLINSNIISTNKPLTIVKCENKTNKKAQIKNVKSKTMKVKQKSSDTNMNPDNVDSKVPSKVNNTEKAKINSSDCTLSLCRKVSDSEVSKNERTNVSTSKRINYSTVNSVSKRIKTTSQKHKETKNNEIVNSVDKLEEHISRNSGTINSIIETTILKSNSDVETENKNKIECNKEEEENKEAEVRNSSKSNESQHMCNDSDNVISRNISDSTISDNNTSCSYNSKTVETLITCGKLDSGSQNVRIKSDKMEREKSAVDEQVCHRQQEEVEKQIKVVNKEGSVKSNNKLNKQMSDNNSVVKISGLIHDNDQKVNCINNTDKVQHDCYSDNNKSSVEAGVISLLPGIESNKQNCTSAFLINKDDTNFITPNGNLSQNTSKSSDVGKIDKAVGHTEVRMGNNCDTQASNSVSTGSSTDQPLCKSNADKMIQHTSLLMIKDINTGQQTSGPEGGDKNTCVQDLNHSDKHSVLSSGMLENGNQQVSFGTVKTNNGGSRPLVTGRNTCVQDLNHSDKQSVLSSGILQNDNQQANFGTSKTNNGGSRTLVTDKNTCAQDLIHSGKQSVLSSGILQNDNQQANFGTSETNNVGSGTLVGDKNSCVQDLIHSDKHSLLSSGILQNGNQQANFGTLKTDNGCSGTLVTEKNTCVQDLIHSDKHSMLSSGMLQNSNQQTNFGTSKTDNGGSETLITDKNTCVPDLIHSDKYSALSSDMLHNSNRQTNFGTSKTDNGGSRTVVTHPSKDTRQFTELSLRNKDIKQNNDNGEFNNLLSVDKMQHLYVDTRHNQVPGLMPGQNLAQSDKITQQVRNIMNTNKSNHIAMNSEIVNLQFNKMSKQIDNISKLTQPSDLMKTNNSGHGSVNLNSNKESGQIINLTSSDKVNNNQISSETDTTQKLQMYQENIFRDSTQNRDRNSFIPINHSCMDDVRLSLPPSEFSNDLFTSLQVPSTGQHPESISPTAAFLLAFPLVSTSKTSEMLVENDNSDSQHATPTTILQIGNIDPPGTDLYHPASPMIMDSNINSFHNLKQKNNGNKNNENTKQHMKSMENFDRYQQQFDINERYQDNFQGNQNFSHNHSGSETNCKQRKVNFLLNQEHEMYTACNKKKNNDRVCSYPGQTNSEVCSYAEKSFERMEFHHTENIAQQTTSQSENQKKSNTLPLLNSSGVQNTYTQSSYSLFSSSNEYPLGISSQYTTTQPMIETTKSLQPSSNFSILPWTCSTTTSSSLNHNDYVSLYTSFPQSIHNKNQNLSTTVKNNSQKNQTCDVRMKDKSVSTSSTKFLGNFQFTDQSLSRQQQDGTSSHYQTNDVSSYKVDNKNKKPKSLPRPPVNWMTAPDIRPVLPDHMPTPIIPDVMFPPQKDIEFSMPQANPVLNSCSNIPSFNISTSISNTPQTFYSNSHFSGLDVPLDLPPLPEITTNTSKPHRSLNNTSNNHNYSWSPSKSTMPSLLPHVDNHNNLMIPSTLPTLVGDLALGTNTGPSTPAENSFKSFNLPNTFPQTNDNTNKKYESRQQESRKVQGKSPERDCVSGTNADRRNSNRSVPDYCNKTHSHQSTNTSGSFLSVSQLVDHSKSEGRNMSRRINKQSQANKQTLQKRNSNVQQQTEKQSTINKNGHSVNYSATGSMNNVQRKTDLNYSDDRNMGINFSGSFPAPNHIPSSTGLWNSNEKSSVRNSTGGQYKGGSYSAESLIGVNQEQDNITDISGSFPMTNQYNSHYSQSQKPYIDPSIVCSTNNYTSDFSHQNLQHSDFSHQQTQHTYQNCFNFSTQNSIYTSTNTAPFISDNEYQIALDSSYVFHHPVTNVNKSHNQACQTTSNSKDTHRQVTHNNNNSKRNSVNNKRRDDYSSMSTNQTAPFLQTSDIYQSSHYSNTCRSAVSSSYQPSPSITSSPPHHGTTTLTNFNLSTIFPEINDKASEFKRAVSGANTFHGNNKLSDSSTTSVQQSVRNEFVPSADTINTQLPPIRTEFNNILSTQQPVVSLNQQVPSSHFTVEGFSNIPPPFQVHQ